MDSIHGHEVLNIMKDNHYTLESLLEEIEKNFGVNATFHTCSSENMSARELVLFLQSKNKFILKQNNEFALDSSKVCNH
ncbi:MAG: YecH family metal-binding protein [Campylobacteraceae bacterium]